MSINFSQASASRIDATRFESDANRQASVQVALFTQWLNAQTSDNDELAVFLRDSFPEPLATAASDWLNERAVDSQAAPQTPFDMSSYVLDDAVRAAAEQERAEQVQARLEATRGRTCATAPWLSCRYPHSGSRWWWRARRVRRLLRALLWRAQRQ